MAKAINNQTNKVVIANTNIMTDSTSMDSQNSTLMVLTSTTGILSLVVDGIKGSLNSGIALDAGQWYAFEVPISAKSAYNLQFSVDATLQIKWIGGI